MKTNKFYFLRIITALYLVVVAAVFLIPVNIVSKLFVIASITNFLFFSYYFKNIYNPATIFMSMFLFMIGCSQVKLTLIEQDNFVPATWIVLFTVIICFYGILAIFIKKHGSMLSNLKIGAQTEINEKTIYWSNIICLLGELLLYYYAIHKIGSIPLFDDYARANIMPKVINNYLMTLLVIPQFFIIMNTVYIIQSKKYYYLIFSTFYFGLLMLLGGRINIFAPAVTSLFYIIIQYHYTEKKNNKKTLLITMIATLSIITSLMISIPLIRTNVYITHSVQNNHTIKNNQVTKHSVTQKGKKYYHDLFYKPHNGLESKENFNPTIKIPTVLLPIWINFSTELHGFNKLVIYLNKTHDYQYGHMLVSGTFHFISKYFIPDPVLDLSKMNGSNWLNILTFMQKPYMDFGVYGIGGFMIIFTLFYMFLYKNIQMKKNLKNSLFYSYFAMNMLFMIFDNPFYYSTIVVNVILLFLFISFMTQDRIAELKNIIKHIKYD